MFADSSPLPHFNLYSNAADNWSWLDRIFITVPASLLLDETMWALYL